MTTGKPTLNRNKLLKLHCIIKKTLNSSTYSSKIPDLSPGVCSVKNRQCCILGCYILRHHRVKSELRSCFPTLGVMQLLLFCKIVVITFHGSWAWNDKVLTNKMFELLSFPSR